MEEKCIESDQRICKRDQISPSEIPPQARGVDCFCVYHCCAVVYAGLELPCHYTRRGLARDCGSFTPLSTLVNL